MRLTEARKHELKQVMEFATCGGRPIKSFSVKRTQRWLEDAGLIDLQHKEEGWRYFPTLAGLAALKGGGDG